MGYQKTPGAGTSGGGSKGYRKGGGYGGYGSSKGFGGSGGSGSSGGSEGVIVWTLPFGYGHNVDEIRHNREAMARCFALFLTVRDICPKGNVGEPAKSCLPISPLEDIVNRNAQRPAKTCTPVKPMPANLGKTNECFTTPTETVTQVGSKTSKSIIQYGSVPVSLDIQNNKKVRGPRMLQLHGENKHRIGDLLPEEGKPPKFCQLYIYDTENEIRNRMQAVRILGVNILFTYTPKTKGKCIWRDDLKEYDDVVYPLERGILPRLMELLEDIRIYLMDYWKQVYGMGINLSSFFVIRPHDDSTYIGTKRQIYATVMEAVDKDKGGMFFVYGYGGTGKTYLYKTIRQHYVHKEDEIVYELASSGIAPFCMEGGRTAHSVLHPH
ncbi:ATP-dependent DNA helicase PIF1-like protein [Tanacetum coccineum]